MGNQPSKVSFWCGMRYLMRSLEFMGKMRGKFFIGTLFASMELLVAYVTPIMFQEIIRALETNSYRGIWITLAALLSASALLTPFIIIGNYWKRSAVIEAETNLSTALFERVEHFSLKTLDQLEMSDYVIRIVNDAKGAVAALRGYTLIALTKFIVYTGISLIILLKTDWHYMVVGLSMSFLALGISFVFLPKARYIEQKAKRMAAGMSTMLMEAVVNAPIIRVFTLEGKLKKCFSDQCRQIAGLRVAFRTVNGIIEGFVYLFGSCVQPVTFLMGIYLMVQGNLELDTVVYLSGITGILAEGIQNFSQFIQFVQGGFVSLARVYELINRKDEEIVSNKIVAAKDEQTPAIHISDLHFRYRDVEVLKGVCLDIWNHQKVAIVGASGSGKSTLMKLIVQLYEPTSGCMEVADIGDDRKEKEEWCFSYVSQSCDVFKGTIRENIGYGKADASFEEIREAARKAGCQAFIERLPDRYDTVIEENGTNLSGGQKQRIAIARAFLKNAPILVLDEMTSAMDSQTEEQILSELMEEVKEKTVLMISHRIHVAQKMDRILVMENGRIVEDGSHEKLMEEKGTYYRMCLEQI